MVDNKDQQSSFHSSMKAAGDDEQKYQTARPDSPADLSPDSAFCEISSSPMTLPIQRVFSVNNGTCRVPPKIVENASILCKVLV